MRKLKLYTNIEKMSPDAAANEEVEQRLSIMNTGKVVLTSSLYGEGPCLGYSTMFFRMICPFKKSFFR